MISQSELKEVLDRHNLWLQNKGGRRANLSGATLRLADLSCADLSCADLSLTNLRRANLSGADLSCADIDFSCWPLWCGSVNIKIDERIAKQILYHAFVVSENFIKPTKKQKNFINQFHRVENKTLNPL